MADPDPVLAAGADAMQLAKVNGHFNIALLLEMPAAFKTPPATNSSERSKAGKVAT